MISKFFIDRPVFAATLSLFITILGSVCLKYLPVEQYPRLAPPMVFVNASYPGASAQMMSDTVAAPIEQHLNGVDNMLYMESQNSEPGNMGLSIYFDVGADPDKALSDVQNIVNLALPSLPDDVRNEGVSVTKSSAGILLFVAVQAEEGLYDEMFISNYATLHVADELQRVKGVSTATVLNARDYSMRIWLKPDRLAQFSLTTSDVLNAIRSRNAMHAIGEMGQEPSTSDMVLNIPVYSLGRLNEPKEFEKIILKADADGSMVLLRDVGRVELGSQSYNMDGKLDGKFFAAIAITQDPSANALDVATRIKSRLEELKKFFPSGLKYSIPYDTTKFVKVSILDVQKTLLQAAILVALVILVFLQSFRAALVPVIAMIVSIVGTFAGMYILGFSVNTLTLFGMVLAVGIVVDDAIVVVENIERNMRDLGLSAKDAAIKTMEEVTGPVIAIVLVLCAVFVPIAFVGGLPGQLYKQFAMTIAVSVVISGFVALTLSPVLAMTLLKTRKSYKAGIWFNNGFTKVTNVYIGGARWLIRNRVFGVGIFVVLLAAIWGLSHITPVGLVPSEDQGYVMVSAELPDGANLKRVEKVSSKIESIAKSSPAVEHVISLSGYSLLNGIPRSKNGAYFVTLKDWSERTAENLSAPSIVKTLNTEFASLPEANIFTFNPPSIQGIGIAGGIEFWILNQGNADSETFGKIVSDFMKKAKERPEIFKGYMSSTLEPDGMQLYLDVDVEKAQVYQVKLEDIFESLQVLLGSVYVNDFNKFGRVFQVVAQAEPSYRSTVEDIGQIYVRSTTNEMIPLKSLVIPKFSKGQTLLTRFNGFPAAQIMAIPNYFQGYGASAAMNALEEVAEEILPQGITFAYSGQAYQQKVSGGASSASLIAGLVMVFLVLAALYERWTLPIAILLAVPFGIFGAFFAVWVRNMPNDIYFQIGLVALIGLSAKNAILIVEFARAKRKAGMGVIDAAIDAARLRFRAIVMTSLTFIIGVLPLLISKGAGAASRHSVGTGVMGGMFFATFFAIFFIPLFFRIIEEFSEKKKKDEK